jgi:hypothetical protein
MRRELERGIDGDAGVKALLDQVVKREIDPASAAKQLLERVETD